MRILISYICYLLFSFFIQFNNNTYIYIDSSRYNFKLNIPSINLDAAIFEYGSKNNDVNKVFIK